MKILSTPHAHTTYCDGKQSAEEMVLTAIEKGFVSLGLSEHGEQSIDSGSSLKTHQVAPYIAEVRALQKKYAERIRLHLGIEKDFYSVARRKDYDYVLASFHYLKKDGVAVINDFEMPSSTIAAGLCEYPAGCMEAMEKNFKVFKLDAGKIAEGLGNAKCMNVVLFGSMVKALGMTDIDWEAVIAETVPAKFKELNLAAYRAGFDAV